MTELQITAEDGYPLSALYASCTDQIGTVVISSATGIKKEYYINFATHLTQSGYNVLLYDYRGIRGSAPANLRSLKSYMHEWGTKDMKAVLEFLITQKKLTNITWVGHSAGAHLVGFLASNKHITKIISISSALGYWKHFPFPQRWLIWFLWTFIAPLMIKLFGYGKMRLIGWGENLPPNMLMEWRSWCLNENYFQQTIKEVLYTDRFYHVSVPIHNVYMSDDFIANDKTVPLMMNFFPNATHFLHKIPIKKYTNEKVGHIGIFRKRFENSLWPVLVSIIKQTNSACQYAHTTHTYADK